MTRYMKQTLQPGEKLLAAGRVHPAYLIVPAIIAYLTACGLMWSIQRFHLTEGLPAAWGVFLLPGFYFIQHLIIWASTEAALTTNRVVAKTGFISRRVSEIALGKIESTDIDQGVIGRLFGFGDLVIQGSGGREASTPGLGRILQFRAEVQNAMGTGGRVS